MAVLKNTYRPYAGSLTPDWSRFLILPRFAWQNVFSSKLLTAFYCACFVPWIVGVLLIYLHHNVRALAVLELPLTDLPPIRGEFYLVLVGIASSASFVLNAFIAPGLISADMANNALPLYLGRPFSRAEYVLGKLTVLAGLFSSITWIPGLILFLLQWALGGNAWFAVHRGLAVAIFLGSWIWILVISLIGLALSAWVKWRLAAGGLILGVFFVAAGFGEAINQIFETRWGSVLNLGEMMTAVWAWLFNIRDPGIRVSVSSAWGGLIGCCLLALELLHRRIRAYEVIK